jgi:hypothetical protein
MKKQIAYLILLMFLPVYSFAQLGPAVTSWILNTTGATGYAGIPSNVQQVQYAPNSVYVSCTCIPGYSIGPWMGNPNIPSNQNFVFKIPRNPVPNTGTLTAVGMGQTGVWKNGVTMYNALDAQSYNGQGIWLQNAYHFELPSFDNCLGHPDQSGQYHHHVSPTCLYSQADSIHHSPLIGFAFDGYPIYGAYGYANTNGTGAITRMTSSFQLRNITDRTTLPDGTVLTASQYGPAVSTQYPVGSYIQDYKYVQGTGTLDSNNGRLCVTPEYPQGTYAYFVTIDAALKPVYPYILGTHYYGIVQAGNTPTGPMNPGGHNIISEPVTTYTTGVAAITSKLSTIVYPNPANDYLFVYIQPVASNNFTARLVDMNGRVVLMRENIQPTISYTLNVSLVPSGIYNLVLNNNTIISTEKVVVSH